jgi:hypothetical protein
MKIQLKILIECLIILKSISVITKAASEEIFQGNWREDFNNSHKERREMKINFKNPENDLNHTLRQL